MASACSSVLRVGPVVAAIAFCSLRGANAGEFGDGYQPYSGLLTIEAPVMPPPSPEPFLHVPGDAIYMAAMQPAVPPPAMPQHSLELKPMSQLFIDAPLVEDVKLPDDRADERHSKVSLGTQLMEARPWQPYEYNFAPSLLSHRPLYFEDVNLERYGNTTCAPCVQPICSGIRFFSTIPLLPYLATLQRPHECVYTLGYCRPGTRAANLAYRPPLRLKPLTVEAAAAAGAILLIP